MMKAIAIFFALLASRSAAETSSVRGATQDSRELVTCDLDKLCYLYEIHTAKRIKTLGGQDDKHYQLPPVDKYHTGYSIECDFGANQADYLKWYFPDGKENFRFERSFPWWMHGVVNGLPDAVHWLSQPGYKYIKLEAYKNNQKCYSTTFEIEAHCPKGYYDWYGHCYEWIH